MPRQICKHGSALLDPGIGIGLAHHLLRARLMQALVEYELGAVLGIVVGGNDRPAGEHLGKTNHVVLGVAGAHAEGMQLEYLARQVLVETARAVDACNRVGPDRLRIVEIGQHGWMAFGGEQHVGKAP